jgi:hypothetical protein
MPSTLRAQVDELQEVLDQVESILQDSYRPEATREDLTEAVGEALSAISPDDETESDEDEDEEEED